MPITNSHYSSRLAVLVGMCMPLMAGCAEQAAPNQAKSGTLPEILATASTPSGDGIVRLPSTNGIGFFAVAAVNVGGAGTITARADDGQQGLPLSLLLCETDAAGNRLGCDSALTRSVAANDKVYYSVFATGAGQAVPQDPASHRLFLHFEAKGNPVGGADVAVTTDHP